MKLRVGVIGLGFMGATHVEAIARSQAVSLHAVCSRSGRSLDGDLRQTGGNLGTAFGVHDFSQVHTTRDWRQLIALPDVDAVDICLPTSEHAEVCCAALSQGKHVLCEKPMGLTRDDCAAILQAHTRSAKVLMVAHVLRFAPAYQLLKQNALDGRLGKLLRLEFVRLCGLPSWSSWLPLEARSGGAILDLLIHDIDQAIAVLGMPDRVAAKPLGDYDAVQASLLYPGGPEVRIRGGWFSPETPFAMSFLARFEHAELEFADGVLTERSSDGSRRLPIDGAVPYAAEIDYFAGCCTLGSTPELCPPQAAAQAVSLALRIKESRAMGGESLSCLA